MSKHTVDQDVTDVEEGVSSFARAVAAKRIAVVGIATTVLDVLVTFHAITPDLSSHADSMISGGLTVLATIGAGAWVHHGTTPANTALIPKDQDGTPLVPAAVAAKLVQAAGAAQLVDVTPEGLIPETGESVLSVPETLAPAADPTPVAAVATPTP